MTAATVALAVANPLERLGLREALGDAGLAVCAEAPDARALLAATQEPPALCVVAGGAAADAIATVGRLASAWPASAVVLLAAAPDADLLLRVVRAGGRGCLAADTPAERLPDLLRGALAGEAAAPPQLFAEVLERLRVEAATLVLADAGGDRVLLSGREAAVLRLLADGRSSAETAAALDISPVTVRRHASRAAARLGARDRATALELVRAAQRG